MFLIKYSVFSFSASLWMCVVCLFLATGSYRVPASNISCTKAKGLCKENNSCKRIYRKVRTKCEIVRYINCRHEENKEECTSLLDSLKTFPSFELGCQCNKDKNRRCPDIYNLVFANPCRVWKSKNEDFEESKTDPGEGSRIDRIHGDKDQKNNIEERSQHISSERDSISERSHAINTSLSNSPAGTDYPDKHSRYSILPSYFEESSNNNNNALSSGLNDRKRRVEATTETNKPDVIKENTNSVKHNVTVAFNISTSENQLNHKRKTVADLQKNISIEKRNENHLLLFFLIMVVVLVLLIMAGSVFTLKKWKHRKRSRANYNRPKQGFIITSDVKNDPNDVTTATTKHVFTYDDRQ